MAKIFPNLGNFMRVLSVAALAAGSVSYADQASANELSYDDALRALKQTKNHTNTVSGWGERRTVPVPKGVDPNSLIKKTAITAPALRGLESGASPKNIKPIKVNVPIKESKVKSQAPKSAPLPTPAVSQKKPATTSQSGGWDWMSSKDTVQNKKASAPVPQAAVTPIEPAAQTKTWNPKKEVQNVQNYQHKPTLTPVSKSSMKTVYEAPVTSKPQEAATPAPTPTKAAAPQSENLLAPTTKPVPASAAAKANKEQAAEYYNRAVKNHLTGKLPQAIADYTAAIAANPDLGQAHCNLGLIYNQQRKYTEAISEFRKALAINPKDAFTYNGIGAALRAQKDYDGALKNWMTATSLKPDLATAHYNLGTIYEIKKDYDKALLSYRQAIKNDYRLGEAYYRSGLIMTRKNRLQDAKEQFKKALEISDKAEYSADARKKIAYIEQKGM